MALANTSERELTLKEIADILRRHEGSMTEIAARLRPPVRSAAVTNVLAGKSASQRILEACRKKALSLLEQERAEEAKGAA